MREIWLQGKFCEKFPKNDVKIKKLSKKWLKISILTSFLEILRKNNLHHIRRLKNWMANFQEKFWQGKDPKLHFFSTKADELSAILPHLPMIGTLMSIVANIEEQKRLARQSQIFLSMAQNVFSSLREFF